MKTIKKIYQKGFVEISRIANGWDKKKIRNLIALCQNDPELLKICVRGDRGKHTIAKAYEYYKQGLFKYI